MQLLPWQSWILFHKYIFHRFFKQLHTDVLLFSVVPSGKRELNDLQKIEDICCGTAGEDEI
jgi:hypothetical protein